MRSFSHRDVSMMYNSCDENKEIGNKSCIFVGIIPDLSQFLNLGMDFLFKLTISDRLH